MHSGIPPRVAVAVVGLTTVAMLHAAPAMAQSPAPELRIEDAIELSPFGGRAAFSPDGKKIAFVDKTYGNAYETDLATRQVRNLTAHVPHQGIVRIQYLPNGDYLVTAPRIHAGPNTRAHLEMWVLDKGLKRGLQPLDQQVFEGIAVSKRANLIAWTVIEPELGLKDSWQMGFIRPTKRYTARISYSSGTPVLTDQREIMSTLPEQCKFIEPQDFRDDDKELIYSCLGPSPVGGVTISVMGNQTAQDRNIVYRQVAGEYNEVEGIAPDGSWAAVECGKQDKPGLPQLDICRLALSPGGTMTRLVSGAAAGSTTDISNPVISPDGKWIAFQKSDSASGEIGEGYGLLLLPLKK